jgi:YegS/Rv2252/BmrU family lipid kinase
MEPTPQQTGQPAGAPASPRAALIVHTHSRKGADQFAQAQSLFEAAGLSLAEAHGVRDPSQMRATVEKALADGAQLVIVGGGDGSISTTIGALIGSEAIFAPLPLGTANSFARGLGIGPGIEEAVATIAAGHSIWVDLAEIDGNMFANSAAMGMPPMIGDTIPPKVKRWFGRVGYLGWAIYSLVRFRPFRLTLESPDGIEQIWATELRMLNGQYTGGIKVSDDAQLDDGAILLQIVSGKSKWSLARDWYLRLLGLRRREGMAREIKVTQARIDAHPRQKVAIDGEVLARTPFALSIHRHAVRVIAPHPDAAPQGEGLGAALLSAAQSLMPGEPAQGLAGLGNNGPQRPPQSGRKTMDKQKIGEGNYEAAEEFQNEQHEFAKSGKAEQKAREAADALDGPEAGELEKARKASADGHSA